MSDLLSNVGNFAKGFGQGLWGGATGMVQGIGSLAQGAYNLATNSDSRAQAWNNAVNAAQTVEWAAQNPGQAASDIGQGATNLYNNFVTAEQQAVANGQGAQFWGNVAGQGAFAAGTVLLPGLAEAKLAGAAGELGDAGELLSAGSKLEDAVPAVTDAANGAATAPVLPNPDALTFVPENSGAANNAAGQAWRDYQSQTIGSDMNPLTGESNVPALQFDNPNPNGNPYVKWDGYQQLPDGTTELIDAKTALSNFSNDDGPVFWPSTLQQLDNKSAALTQNPGYSGVIEVPNTQVAADAQTALDQLGIDNIDVRVRPFQDATDALPDAATTDGTAPLTTFDPTLEADLGASDPGAAGTTSATSFPNTGNLIGTGLLGADALGNLLSPSSQTDPMAAAVDTTPLFSATYGINPDGSLTTLSPPALVSPGDGSITPPQPLPTTLAPLGTTPVSPPAAVTPPSPPPAPAAVTPPSPPPAATPPSPPPVAAAPPSPPPAAPPPSPPPVAAAPPSPPPAAPPPSPPPVAVAPPSPPPAPVVITPPSPPPAPVVITPPSPPPAPVVITPPSPPPAPVAITPPSPPPDDISGIDDGGGDGGMDDMAAMDDMSC